MSNQSDVEEELESPKVTRSVSDVHPDFVFSVFGVRVPVDGGQSIDRCSCCVGIVPVLCCLNDHLAVS